MSSLEALEARLRAQPDDWPSWLVYADYLTDRGDERGELIVLEHRLERRLEPREAQALEIRIQILTDSLRRRWLQGLPAPAGARLQWRHGFVVEAALRWNAGALGAFAALRAHPGGRLLARLDLQSSSFRDRDVAELGRAEALRGLLGLKLGHNGLGAEGAKALAETETLGSLLELRLNHNRLGDEGASALAEGGALRSLQRLHLGANRIGAAGASALARSETLRSLLALDLSDNLVGAAGAAALASSETLRSLHTLNLWASGIGDAGAVALASTETLCALKELYLRANQISAAGEAALARSETLRYCMVLT